MLTDGGLVETISLTTTGEHQLRELTSVPVDYKVGN